MTIVDYRKVKCDECGKEEEVKGSGSRPSRWLEISITGWEGNSGMGRLNREVCSEKCALKLLNKLKEIPEKENYLF